MKNLEQNDYESFIAEVKQLTGEIRSEMQEDTGESSDKDAGKATGGG